jgi:hypothetical protein
MKIPVNLAEVASRPERGKFNRVNLSEVTATEHPLVLHGTAYVGWPSLVSGPTGSGKTLVCRWLVLEADREGLFVGLADQEMGETATAAYFRQMGASDRELEDIVYWDMPSPTDKTAPEWVDEVKSSVEVLLMDKVPDFLRSAMKAENSNDDVNSWMASFVEPLRGEVTTLLIDATGWEGKHSRGGSEKDFKVALAWMVEVLDEPRRDHVGRIRWTCTKDRFGAVGKGRSIEFAIGGDGNGHIVGSMVGTTPNQGSNGLTTMQVRQRAKEDGLRVAAVTAARQFAPDEVGAITRTQLAAQMGALNNADKYIGMDLAMSDFDPGHKEGGLSAKPKPGAGSGTLVWWRPILGFSSVVPDEFRNSSGTEQPQEQERLVP